MRELGHSAVDASPASVALRALRVDTNPHDRVGRTDQAHASCEPWVPARWARDLALMAVHAPVSLRERILPRSETNRRSAATSL